MSPFQALYGRLSPKIPDYVPGSTTIDLIGTSLQTRDDIMRTLRENLRRTRQRMADQANKHRAVAYDLELPPESRVHSVVHVSLLRPYFGTDLHTHYKPLPHELKEGVGETERSSANNSLFLDHTPETQKRLNETEGNSPHDQKEFNLEHQPIGRPLDDFSIRSTVQIIADHVPKAGANHAETAGKIRALSSPLIQTAASQPHDLGANLTQQSQPLDEETKTGWPRGVSHKKSGQSASCHVVPQPCDPFSLPKAPSETLIESMIRVPALASPKNPSVASDLNNFS
ncbi:Ty3/gypsy retrotransposon protein [Sesbania bispinosa]|nr:Ty3/gypsy retrotransposon protein [Sesbania bispinosa]